MSKHFQIAVIGSGPGGYIAALKAAQSGAKTAIVEKHLLGGTCLNYGCIPSKALLASAEMIHKIKRADFFGVSANSSVTYDWQMIQKRKDKVVSRLRRGVKGLFDSRKVKLFTGKAQLAGPGRVNVISDKGAPETVTADSIILAVGSFPAMIAGWPDDSELVCTSDEALHWKQLPKRLIVVGGGVVGCEFACMMHEYGVDVTIVEIMDNLLPEMETQLGSALADIFIKRGINIFTNTKVEQLTVQDKRINAVLSDSQTIEAGKVLVATGRKADTSDIGLESVGLERDRGFICVDDKMQTPVKGYYCVGDANGRYLLAHAASAQAMVAVKNALGGNEGFDLPIPSAVHTFPEIASVGMTSQQARAQQIPVSIGQFPIGRLGKAMAVGEESGFVKVIRHQSEGTLLGVHMLGHNATEVIASATAMVGTKVNANQLAEMVFAHPTIGEAVKEAAEDTFRSALNLPPRKVRRVAAVAQEI